MLFYALTMIKDKTLVLPLIIAQYLQTCLLNKLINNRYIQQLLSEVATLDYFHSYVIHQQVQVVPRDAWRTRWGSRPLFTPCWPCMLCPQRDFPPVPGTVFPQRRTRYRRARPASLLGRSLDRQHVFVYKKTTSLPSGTNMENSSEWNNDSSFYWKESTSPAGVLSFKQISVGAQRNVV